MVGARLRGGAEWVASRVVELAALILAAVACALFVVDFHRHSVGHPRTGLLVPLGLAVLTLAGIAQLVVHVGWSWVVK